MKKVAYISRWKFYEQFPCVQSYLLLDGVSDLTTAIITKVSYGREKKVILTTMKQVKEELCVLNVYMYVINNYNH